MSEEIKVSQEDTVIKSEESNPKEASGIVMSDSDMKDLFNYLMGGSVDVPEKVTRLYNNLTNKLTLALGFSVAVSTARQTKLSNFLSEAEDSLFNMERFESMTDKEKAAVYREARSTYNSLLEIQRKIVAQNADKLQLSDSPTQKILDKLMTLSPDKQNSLIQMMESLEAEEPESKVEDLLEEEE